MWEYIILLVLLIVVGCVIYKLRHNIVSTILKEGGYKKPNEQMLYFVRHGETDVNLKNMNNKKELKTPINATGQKQAKKTGKYFKKLQDSCHFQYTIYSSPSLRAKQTADIIAKELGIPTIKYDDRLVESGKGDVAGMTDKDPLMKEMIKDYDKYKQKTLNDNILFSYNIEVLDTILYEKYKMEPFPYTKSRVKKFVDDLPNSKHIIIVTHSGLIQAALTALFNVDTTLKGNTTNGKNTTITAILKTKNQYRLLTLPNTEHLK